jgi:hypothetical protein
MEVPVSVPDFKVQEYHLPDELPYIRQKFDFLYQKFYPIGWSQSGYFAYISEPVDEACGCYFFELIIQNMVTDKVSYRFSFNDQGAGETLKSVWDKKQTMFAKKLSEYSIVQDGGFKLAPESFEYSQQKYSIKYKTRMEKDSDFMLDLVKQYKINLVRGSTTKIVCDEQIPKNDAILNLIVSGVVTSPYENRIAIVVQEERRGFEGPPNILNFRLIGSNLEKGFENK